MHIEVSNIAAAGDDKEEDSETQTLPDRPQELFVTANATRELTGLSSVSDLRVVPTEGGDYIVLFNPKIEDKEDFTLNVFCSGQHIKGSPFLLRYVQPLALSSVHTEKREAVMDAGKRVNLIVPYEGNKEMHAVVEGPFGLCPVETNCLPAQCISIGFMPKGVGAYSVNVTTADGEEITNNPFVILADFTSEEAESCYIIKEDEHLFKKVIKFTQEGVSFRIFTDQAPLNSNGRTNLNIVCSGPGKATVKIGRDPEELGLKKCEFVPSVAGSYRLNILWKGQHISGSPCTLLFRRPKTLIGSNGLNLHRQKYNIGVPYKFRLNCSEITEEDLCIQCTPPEAADIVTEAVEGRKYTYKCRILPKEIGEHVITIKCKEKDIVGSPFKVSFEDSSDPSACAIVKDSRCYEPGGTMSVNVTTEGAGYGVLAATVQDLDTSTFLPVTTKMLSKTLYKVAFEPGESVACNLSVTYNKHDICGSPFKLVFSDPNKFKLKGEGLLGGHVGEWNSFSLDVSDPPPGDPMVCIERDDGQSVESTITLKSSEQFEVKYFPRFPGNYKIGVKWGQVPIPGSPFHVRCSTAVFEIKDQPKVINTDRPLEFKVHLVSGSMEKGEEKFRIAAKGSLKGDELLGIISPVDDEQRIYSCTLPLQNPGRYMVSIKWNRLNIKGSPFMVKALTLPTPENVRVSGPGVEDGIADAEKEFTIETKDAGSGLLAIKVNGPSRKLKVKTVQDPQNKRTIHAHYHPTTPGLYTVEVLWAETHVPGSPFRIALASPPPMNTGDKLMIVVDVHSEVHPENEPTQRDREIQSQINPEAPSAVCVDVHPEDVALTLEDWKVEKSNNKRQKIKHQSHMELEELSREEEQTGNVDGENDTAVYMNGITESLSQEVVSNEEEVQSSNHTSLSIDGQVLPCDTNHNPITPSYHSINQAELSSNGYTNFKLLPNQESLESTTSLHDITQTYSDSASTDDEICITLESEVSFNKIILSSSI